MIIGHLDTADYLVEQWSIWLVEIPFIVFWAVYERKYGWKTCLEYILFGALLSFILTFQEKSITPAVYLKASFTGLILGEASWFRGSFTRRFVAVSFPGVVLSLVFGLPIILSGVTTEVIERFRQDALEMYRVFMSADEALKAADNAMQMFRGIFKAGLAVFMISAPVYAWMSFIASKLLMRRFNEEPEDITPFHNFKLPFHVIWIFLGAFGLLLSEYALVFPIALNIFVFMAFLYLIQGIAIVMFQMNKFSMGRLPRVIFWLLFFFTLVFTGVILIFTGVIDSWFNLRSIASDNDIPET